MFGAKKSVLGDKLVLSNWRWGYDTAVLLFHSQDAPLSWYDEGVFEKITNFSGSAGCCLFGKIANIFGSDSRYKDQMNLEISRDWISFVDSMFCPKLCLQRAIDVGYREILLISDFCSVSKKEKIENFCKESNVGVRQINFASFIKDFATLNPIFDSVKSTVDKKISIPDNKAGLSKKNKLKILLDKIQKMHLSGLVLITDQNLSSWLLNSRTQGFSCNMLIRENLLVDSDKIIKIKKLEDFAKISCSNKKVYIDPTHTNLEKVNLLVKYGAVIEYFDGRLFSDLYCVKNKTEIAEITKTHIKDGIALLKFLHWLSCQEKDNKHPTEFETTERLYEFRKEDPSFLCNSFPTISAVGKNGAIIHYSKSSNKIKIKPNTLYLCDSGGQYMYGTTDITRTILIGVATKEQKFIFTMVLKAHIALSTAVFPCNTTAKQLDLVSRKIMNSIGLNYPHSTGHGVGYLGNVHEGYINISPNSPDCLQEGMIFSNEPAYYKPNKYGIRIENIMEVVKYGEEKSDTENLKHDKGILISDNSTKGNLLSFRTLSLTPIDTRLIDFCILNTLEKEWLRFYHQKIARSFGELLPSEMRPWLKNLLEI